MAGADRAMDWLKTQFGLSKKTFKSTQAKSASQQAVILYYLESLLKKVFNFCKGRRFSLIAMIFRLKSLIFKTFKNALCLQTLKMTW